MAITKGYATVAELGDKMGLDSAKELTHTPLLESSITNASRLIDLKTNSFFFQQTFTDETIDVTGRSDNDFYITRNCLDIITPSPVITITSLTESDEVLTEKTSFGGTGDFFVKQTQGVITKNSGLWSTAPLAVLLTGDFGYAATPAEVNEICLTIASVFTRLDNRTVTDAEGDMEAILASRIPTWVFKALRRLARPIT